MRETRRERRYKGRAIRKARREAVAAVESIDWAAIGQAWADVVTAALDAVADIAVRAQRVAADAVAAVFDALAWHAAEQRRARRDWMLTHRAIEAPRERGGSRA